MRRGSPMRGEMWQDGHIHSFMGGALTPNFEVGGTDKPGNAERMAKTKGGGWL